MTLKAYRTQINPTDEQVEKFDWWGEIRNGVYNWGRSVRQAAWKRQGKSLTHYDLDGLVTTKKKRNGFEHWSEPPRKVLYFALRDVDAAFQHFFRRLEEGETPGYPNRADPYRRRFTVFGDAVRIKKNRIRIPKAGWVHVEEPGYLPTGDQKLSEVTISKDVDKWVISVQAHVDSPIEGSRLRNEEERPDILAVHPGVRTWVMYSDGARYHTIRLPMEEMARMESKIDRLHKRLQRREPGSNGSKRARQKLARAYRRLRNMRSDATHKASARLCYNVRPRTLLIQNWDVSSMMETGFPDVPRHVERYIRRRMSNANMGELLRQLRYKAEWAEVEVVEIPEEVPVTERHALCGYRNEVSGQEMVHCGGCGKKYHRERNAIKNYFLEYKSDTVAQG